MKNLIFFFKCILMIQNIYKLRKTGIVCCHHGEREKSKYCECSFCLTDETGVATNMASTECVNCMLGEKVGYRE